MEANNIGSLIHYPIPPHLSDAYSKSTEIDRESNIYPLTQNIANQVISLPIGPHLHRLEAQKVVKILLQLL